MDHVWTCRCCGKQYQTLPMSYAPEAPGPWLSIPEAERSDRGKLNSDACVIEGKHFFIRGCLEIPVAGRQDYFIWGVWISLSQQSFERIGELWDVETRDNEPPFSGWLCTELSIYPSTFGLKTRVHLRNTGQRPFVELEPTDHPLAVEQREGMTLHRVEEIAAALLQHQ